ncbi:MAG TPA: methyltransferase [Sphingobacterium sp.]|nr:methyltransferase [Sphingobacterium sp.]
MSSTFRFKQFAIDQQGSALKINTDGVLLGAIAQHSMLADQILDIGTGTGVIALMLAQRYPKAHIDAVEIDHDAAQCAMQNFCHSPFSHRLHVIEGSYETIEKPDFYDWIVSNPPFYTNSLHNPDIRKKNAKHTDITFFEKLLTFANNTLKSQGELHLILPTILASEIISLAREQGMTLLRTISIRSYAENEIIRRIICLRKGTVENEEESNFVIYAGKGKYSDAYRKVLQPYFLAF